MEFPTDKELFPKLDTSYGTELIKKFEQVRVTHVKKLKKDMADGKLTYTPSPSLSAEMNERYREGLWENHLSYVAGDIGKDWENLLVDELVKEEGKNVDGFPIVPLKIYGSDITAKEDDSVYFFPVVLKDINAAMNDDRPAPDADKPSAIYRLWQPMFYAIYKAGKGELIKRLFQLLLCIVIVAAVLVPGYWYVITQPGTTGEFPKFLIILALIVLTPIGAFHLCFWLGGTGILLWHHLKIPRLRRKAISMAKLHVLDAYRVLRFLTRWAAVLPNLQPEAIPDDRFEKEVDAAKETVEKMQKCFDKYVEMYVNN